MTAIFYLLGIVAMLVGGILIFAVTIQNSKGGGLSSTFGGGGGGGASSLLGSRRSTEIIEKVTWYLFAGMAILAFFSNVVGTNLANSDPSKLEMEETLNASDAYNETTTQLPTFEDQPQEQPAAAPEGNE